MTRILIKLVALLIPIIIVLGITELTARRIPSGYSIKRQIIEQNIEDAELIILGSSHTYFGIKAKLFDVRALNMAYVSQDIYYDSRLMLKYLPRAKNLKVVILPVSYFSLYTNLEEDDKKWRTSFYYQVWGIRPPSFRLKAADYSAIGLFGLNESRWFLLTGQPPQAVLTELMDDSGSGIDERLPNISAVLNASQTLRQHESSVPDAAAANTSYLNELISALKARNIRVVIITTPVFRSYSEGVNARRFAEFQKDVALICRDNNLEYYNYFKDDRFGVEDFADRDHLNTQGSEKFTLLLKRDLFNSGL